MSVTLILLLALAVLVIGFMVGWLAAVLSVGLALSLNTWVFLGLLVLVAGFLIGWLVEWGLDNQYRRMRERGPGGESRQDLDALSDVVHGALAGCQQEVSTLRGELHDHEIELQEQGDELQRRRAELDRRRAEMQELRQEYERYRVAHPDDLTVIRGIGRTYQHRLSEAGLRTYAHLAATTPERIGEALGTKNWQRLNLQSWIDQARELVEQE
jgi:predicted flap endonuclease-1-like 5' DNA nuclease